LIDNLPNQIASLAVKRAAWAIGRLGSCLIPVVRLQVGERQKLLGLHALPLYTLVLDGVRVSKENRLGGIDGHDFAPIIDSSRLALAAMAVGMSKLTWCPSKGSSPSFSTPKK